MSKSKCVHMMSDRRPLTKCGVDTALKKGAEWTADVASVTCQNCLKLMNGGQMGGPPPSTAKPEQSEEDKRRWKYEDRVGFLDRMVTKMEMVGMEAMKLISGATENEEMEDLVAVHEYVDMAKERLKIVRSSVEYTLRHECGGNTGK